MIEKHPILIDLKTQQYIVEIAQTEQDVDAALRLRFDVFGKELHRNFTFTNSRDYDKYDDQSHHLIVRHIESDAVIGTYRLQTWEMATKAEGFYTSKRFHIEQFPEDVLKNAVEVGRACIHPDHRNGRVLFLLWKGLAGYLEYFQKRYLFGYSALDTANVLVALNTYKHLAESSHLHDRYDIEVKDTYKADPSRTNGVEDIDIPPLLKNYIEVGTKVCSKPAHDSILNIIHFLILLDIETITDRTRKLFFGK